MMLHPRALDQIAAFNQIPSLAFTVASPSTRLAVERHYEPQSYVTVTLDPIQRTISYHRIFDKLSINKCIFPSLWWLQNKRNIHVPLALELRSCFTLSESKTSNVVDIEPLVPTHMHCLLDTKELQAYFKLHSLRSLVIYLVKDLRWLKLLVNLEELDVSGVGVSSKHVRYISALSNLRVLALDIDDVSSLKWVSWCHKLTELKLLGDASSTSHLNAILTLQQLSFLIISFLGEGESIQMDWLIGCHSIEKLDIGFKGGSYPPVWSLPRLSRLRISYRRDYKTTEGILQLGPELCVDDPSGLTHVELSDSDTCDIQWLMTCPRVHVLHACGCTSISDFTVLGYLVQLTILDIGYTEVSSIDWISNCVALIDLNISNCRHLKDLVPIGTLKNLEILDMENTAGMGTTASTWLPKCAQLEELNASNSGIQWNTVAQLRMLRKLSLRRCSTDTHLDVVTPCTRLCHLDVTGCFSIKDLTALAYVCQLRYLNVQYTSVTSIEALASCAVLEKLYMDAENITDLQSISKFPSLSYIDFGVVSTVKFKAIEECLSSLPYMRIPECGGYAATGQCHVVARFDPLWQSPQSRQTKERKSG